MSEFPQMFRVRQLRERPVIDDVAGEVDRQLGRLKLAQRVQPGQTVAITAGSRGIANIAVIMRAAVEHLKRLGAQPFIVPAMGSHGGGTAEGQRRIIEGYGITEQFVGCPIRATMETAVVCHTDEGIPVHFDRLAYEADHVLVCGRVKPHTRFAGEIESGLMKMMLIGLGKHAGARIYHRAILDYSFDQIVRSVGQQVLNRCRVLAGLAIVENAYDETARIEAVPPDQFLAREKELLVLAKQWMPRLPFDRADILIVDEFGKNISGTGIDTNVVGRKYHEHGAAEDEWPKIKLIILRGLTPETHGNASGLGLAEFCHRRVLDQMDRAGTWTNCLTAGRPSGATIPIHYDSDRQLLQAALQIIGLAEPPDARMLWIRNTLQLAEVECSRAYWQEAQQRQDLELISPPRDIQFDSAGDLVPFPQAADRNSSASANDA